jgi:hypothetical protein
VRCRKRHRETTVRSAVSSMPQSKRACRDHAWFQKPKPQADRDDAPRSAAPQPPAGLGSGILRTRAARTGPSAALCPDATRNPS